MNILIHVFSWPPVKFSGADMMLYRLMQRMPEHNFKLHIEPYMKPQSTLECYDKYRWCDCVWTHLVLTSPITKFARQYGKPVFHFVHNGNLTTLPRNEPDNYLVYNTYHLQSLLKLPFDSIVVNPPVYAEEYQRRTGKYVTLVNCGSNKGYGEFLRCANQLPYMQFQAVEGGYGTQLKQQSMHRNIHFLPHTPTLDLTSTGALLVPSRSESWSLVAAEAQACGVPVIASDLPGLRENLGDTALYGNFTRNLMDLWTDVHLYEKYVNLGLMNTEKKQVKQDEQLQTLNSFMKEKVEQPRPKKEKVVFKPSHEKREIR